MKQELVYDCVEKKFNCWSMKPSLRPSLPDSPKLKLKNHHFGSLVSEKSKLKILGIVFLVNLKWWRIANTDYIYSVQRKSVSATCNEGTIVEF